MLHLLLGCYYCHNFPWDTVSESCPYCYVQLHWSKPSDSCVANYHNYISTYNWSGSLSGIEVIL